MRAAAVMIVSLSSALAVAQPVPEPGPEPTPEPPPAEPAEPAEPAAPTPADLAARIDALEQRAERVEVLEQRIATLHERLQTLMPLRRFITAFVDVGWFKVGGNGAGVRSDVGHRYVSDYDHVPAEWVLLGDPLTTAVNALGEPADIGDARAIEHDTLDSGGHSTFVVNAVGLALGHTFGTTGVSMSGLVEFLPRPGPDILAVEYAHVDYRPTNELELVLSAGKIDSVLGIEYRAQDAPRRLTVTPSLACRYTCGRPYGVQGRLRRGALSLSASLTNGDSFDERFEPDHRLASSKVPTVSGHAQWMFPWGNGLELGVSAAFGPQDGHAALHVHQWHYGFDARLKEIRGIAVQAEFVHGKQQGSSTGAAHAADASDPMTVAAHCSIAQCLTYKAAYGLASWRAKRWLKPYARIDWRDARHQRGIEFLYVARVLRNTVGLHFEITHQIHAKVEYSHNHELIGPQFPNDVLTTSVVVFTD